MSDSAAAAGSEATGAFGSGWLRAARWSALTCAIALVAGFAAEAAVAHDVRASLLMFGRWVALSLVVAYLLFRRGKNALGFALGLGAATGVIALLALVSSEFAPMSEVLRHVLLIVAIFGGVLPPFGGMMQADSRLLAALGVALLGAFSIASAMLAISCVAAFRKMAREAEGAWGLRFAFWGGIFCAPAVWVMFMVLWLSLIGGFHM